MRNARIIQLCLAWMLMPCSMLSPAFTQELDLNPADSTPLVDLLDLSGKAPQVEGGELESKAGETTKSLTAAVAEDTLPPPKPVNEAEVVEEADSTELPADAARTAMVRELEAEPLLRGPVHEAFANPVTQSSAAATVITKTPPESIDEIPPEIQDDRSNMQWIPGYWAWEPQTKDFVWVSGVWRKKPKDRQWVAGRWEAVDQGFQRVPGTWLPVQDGEVVVKKEVITPPPESLEKGPTGPAPSEAHFWVPGTWLRSTVGSYAWRPGYWSRSQENWVWVPDHYVWDPAGCVFVPGYWDYTWERRGTLYAPCTFNNFVPGQRVTYRPTRIVDTDQWLLNLWMGPGSRSYYFGDYYDCATLGYTPWYRYYGGNRGFYDPLYSYYRWRFPATYGVGLYGYLNQLHLYYGSHPALRPNVRLSPYRQFGNRGYVSLFGDVVGLSRLTNFDLNNRNRYGYRRDYLDDYFYGNRYRNNRGYGYRDFDKGNGQRDFGRGRDGRGDLDGRRGRDAGDLVDRSRNRDQRNRGVNTLGPVRQTPLDDFRPGGGVRPGGMDRPQRGGRDRTDLPNADVVQRDGNRGGGNRGGGNRDGNIRPDRGVGRDGSRGPVRGVDRGNDSDDRGSSVRNSVVRTPSSSRSNRASDLGFSISGMKNARNRADVERQRAAMQRYIQQNRRPNSGSSSATRNSVSPRQSTILRQPNASRASSVSRPAAPISRSQGPVRQNRVAPRPTSTPRANPVRSTPAPRVSTPRPTPTSRGAVRSTPSAPARTATPAPSRSRSSGFSISGMKNSRSRADVQRQRNAMQNLMQQRKGRK